MSTSISSEVVLEVNNIMERCWSDNVTNLTKAELDREYVIKEIKSCDEELKSFLFTLGCYEGEKVTVISRLSDNYVILVKDARYSVDKFLAESILI